MLEAEINRINKYENYKNFTQEQKQEKDFSLWKNWLLMYKKRLEKDNNTKNRNKIMKANNPSFVLR